MPKKYDALTKSKITSGLQCHKKLWFDIHQPIKKDKTAYFFIFLTNSTDFIKDMILCSNFERLKNPRPMTVATLYTCDGKQFLVHGSHENVFVFRHDKKIVERIELLDLPFGIGLTVDLDKDLFFKSQQVSLDKGDILILCTDGIVEAGNSKGEEFGEGRLKKIVINKSENSLEDLKQAVLLEASQFMSKELKDDVALIMLRAL